MKNVTNQNIVVDNTVPNNENQVNNAKGKKTLPNWAYIIGVVIVIIAVNFFGGQSINDVAVGCAKTVVSEQLKAPSSAIWHDCKVVDKDSYGKYLVYINVEATNSFGGYITNEYLVVVKDVKRSGKFSYNPNFAVQSVTSSTYDLVEDVTKRLNNWNEKE